MDLKMQNGVRNTESPVKILWTGTARKEQEKIFKNYFVCIPIYTSYKQL